MSKVGSSTQKEKPRLKRHGVAGWLETLVGSCFCGAARWHACIHGTAYDGSAHNVEITYPACHRCFGSRSSQRAHTAYGQSHPGLTERESWKPLHTHEACRDAICWVIALVTGKHPTFEPGIEAYMYSCEATRRIYPHLVSDYFWGLTTYWPDEGTIRRHDTGEILIKFPSKTKREWNANHFMHNDTVLPYATEVDEAYKDYLADHNHRGISMEDARGRLAWLLGEYLLDREARFYKESEHVPKNIPGFRLATLVHPGEWQPHDPSTANNNTTVG